MRSVHVVQPQPAVQDGRLFGLESSRTLLSDAARRHVSFSPVAASLPLRRPPRVGRVHGVLVRRPSPRLTRMITHLAALDVSRLASAVLSSAEGRINELHPPPPTRLFPVFLHSSLSITTECYVYFNPPAR